MTTNEIKPFRIDIPQTTLDDLKTRLTQTPAARAAARATTGTPAYRSPG